MLIPERHVPGQLSFSIQALSVQPECYPFLKFLPLNKFVYCFLMQAHLSSQGTRRTQ